MKDEFAQQWVDFKGRFQHFSCAHCKCQNLNFSEPRFGNIAGVDVAIVTCSNCGHVELFDVAEISRIGIELDKEYREKGWR